MCWGGGLSGGAGGEMDVLFNAEIKTKRKKKAIKKELKKKKEN